LKVHLKIQNSNHQKLQLCGTQAHKVAILALSGIVCGSITIILHALKAFFGSTNSFGDFQ
jgi:hypothetical protein